MRATIFVTDDDEAVRSSMTRRLSRRQHRIRSFDSGEALLDALDYVIPDVILLDLKMSGLNGIETLKQIRPKAPHSLVILLTADGTVEDAVEAIKLGAYDVLIKSVDLGNVDPVINRALEFLELRRRVNLPLTGVAGHYALNNVIAESPSMRGLVSEIKGITQNPHTVVLLIGETGTGKEFVARVLHHNGPRNNAPFVGVNCTAIPPELFDSELFGYERGACTEAVQPTVGLCELAEGGTLFLDEIGDLNLGMQAKLLRVIQERSLKRLGVRDDFKATFRLIAATSRDLRKEVSQGNFREDLYFRLNVVSLDLPPLRQRAEDIIPLCLQALGNVAKEIGKVINDIDDEARTLLERYPYPGNIRELQNIIERAVIFCTSTTLTAGDLPRELHESGDRPVTFLTKNHNQQLVRIEMTLGKHTLADIEAAVIEEVMRLTDCNKSQAAKQLGLTRFALDRRLKRTEDD